MQPRDTTYHILVTPGDRLACEQFRAIAGEEPHEFGHPTVYAIRNKQLIAYLSSYFDDGVLVCGPAVFLPGIDRRYVFMRLVEAFEQVLTAAGVTTYMVSIPADNPTYRLQVERLGYQYVENMGTHLWYRRNLKE